MAVHDWEWWCTNEAPPCLACQVPADGCVGNGVQTFALCLLHGEMFLRMIQVTG